MTKMATTLTPKTIVITTVRRPSASLSPSSDNSDDMECAPRKRRRLTHLSPDEKVMRRKMKNRVAAQTARDRKKALMTDLEIRVAELEAENRLLQVENGTLRTTSSKLTEENHELKERLGQTDSSSVPQKKVLGSPESAVLIAPLQQEQIQTLSHWVTYCLGCILTMSLTFCLASSNKSMGKLAKEKLETPNWEQAVPLDLSPARKTALCNPKWWGPQQRSWNPSKNL